MSEQQDHRGDLIKKIIEIELEMFQTVKSKGPAPCQERTETFRAMRWMAHSVLSEDTLESYLDDVTQAKHAGRNLMTEKYGRMEGIIPPLKDNPVVNAMIDEITRVEESWMQEFSGKYPRIVTNNGAGFSSYFRCELETYSDRTLELYHRDVLRARDQGANFAEISYTNLFKRLGYASLDEVNSEPETKG